MAIVPAPTLTSGSSTTKSSPHHQNSIQRYRNQQLKLQQEAGKSLIHLAEFCLPTPARA